jgi:ABC-type glycerol-3-phosphate transport system substrate-binding protein
MSAVLGPVTRRGDLARGALSAATVLLAACGPVGQSGGQSPAAEPQEVTWSRQPLGEPRDSLLIAHLRRAAEATGVRIADVLEPGGTPYLEKRTAEHAGGTASVDVMYNQLNWHLPLGLQGALVDHYPYFRRDRVDTKQWYQASFEQWAWKGKLYAIAYQTGGAAVLFNKALFGAKGVKLPHKDWTYDEFLEAARRLTDPAGSKFGVEVGQNGVHYQLGTFILGFGGQRLNEAKDRALWGDDPKSIQGAEFDVDLHTRHRVTPTAEARQTLPANVPPMEAGMVAMELNGLFRHVTVRAAIGAEHLDFAPPPKGPTGLQRVAVGGNAWSIMALSKARETAWKVLKWTFGKEGMAGPLLQFVSWPPLTWAAASPQWLDLFKGTHIADCARVWETGGHDLLPLPEGDLAWSTMNAPLNQALRGEIATREAMRESARQLNELFAQRPAAWR